MNLRMFEQTFKGSNLQMVNATFECFLPYKEMCWLLVGLCSPGTLHMYSRVSE